MTLRPLRGSPEAQKGVPEVPARNPWSTFGVTFRDIVLEAHLGHFAKDFARVLDRRVYQEPCGLEVGPNGRLMGITLGHLKGVKPSN